MSFSAEQIPDDYASLKTLLIVECKNYDQEHKRLNLEIKNKDAEIACLEELLKLSKHRIFGRSSEKYAGMKNLFNEIEEETSQTEDNHSDDDDDKDECTDPKPPKPRGTPKRGPLPSCLTRKEVIVEIPEDQRLGCDGKPLSKIGEEVAEHLEIEPAKFTVIRTIRYKYGKCSCSCCIKTAPVPLRAFPKSIAGASLLAFIVASKFCDGLPLYRVSEILKRSGIAITRGLMASWMIRTSEILTPLYNLLEDELLASPYLNCDETRVQVLNEKDKLATSQSQMWIRSRDGPDPIVLYEYDPTRSGDVALRLLSGFKGYLQVDGYAGYDAVCKNDDVIRVGCWAHSLRKFDEAIKGCKNPKKASVAKKALKYIRRLAKIEDLCENQPYEKIMEIREEKSKPILEAMRKWLDETIDLVPPKTLTGKALYYLNAQWPTLIRYLEHGSLKMTNNFAENQIRPFVVGRKAWLFSASVKGANASAILYSLAISAKSNGIDIFKYMKYVLEEIPKAQTVEDYEVLLPHRAKYLLDSASKH